MRANLLAVPTWQPAQQDLSEISDVVNEERRALLKNFDAWAGAVRARLGVHWSDASCPVEGCAHFGTPGSTIYNELEGLTTLLRYDSLPIGCCGIVLHPKWQRRAYPVTFFTTAPYDVLQAAILGARPSAPPRRRRRWSLSGLFIITRTDRSPLPAPSPWTARTAARAASPSPASGAARRPRPRPLSAAGPPPGARTKPAAADSASPATWSPGVSVTSAPSAAAQRAMCSTSSSSRLCSSRRGTTGW